MLRSKFFQGAHLVVIEPLADRLIAEVEGCDLQDAAEVHSRPAEQLIESLVGTADLVVSINVVDHGFGLPGDRRKPPARGSLPRPASASRRSRPGWAT
jgi:hypothetical protein